MPSMCKVQDRGTSIVVSGCSDPSIAININGIFSRDRRDHHGRGAYVKRRLRGALGENAFLYFWGSDEYKAKGWYLGAKIGKETRLTWAYHSSKSETPPVSGWIVNGAVDEQLMVKGRGQSGDENPVMKTREWPTTDASSLRELRSKQEKSDEQRCISKSVTDEKPLAKATASSLKLSKGVDGKRRGVGALDVLTTDKEEPRPCSIKVSLPGHQKSLFPIVDPYQQDAADNLQVNVSGCSDPSIAINIRGTFKHLGESEGRPTWKLGRRGPLSEDVYLYFKTFEGVSGWWIGLSMRAKDKNLCFNKSLSQLPPLSGWMVQGVLDSTLHTVVRQPPQQLVITAKKIKKAKETLDDDKHRQSSSAAIHLTHFMSVLDCNSVTRDNLVQLFATAGWTRPEDEDSLVSIRYMLQNELSSQNALTYVCWATQGNALAGALILSLHPLWTTPCAQIQFIVSALRGTGWLLIKAAVDFIHSRGVRSLYSAADLSKECTPEKRGSLAAHLRWGFQEIAVAQWEAAGLIPCSPESVVQYMKYVGTKCVHDSDLD